MFHVQGLTLIDAPITIHKTQTGATAESTTNGVAAGGCLIASTSKISTLKNCRRNKRREESFSPIKIQFGLCGLADFHWKKKRGCQQTTFSSWEL